MTTWSKATLRLTGAALTQEEIDRRFGTAPRVLRSSNSHNKTHWFLDSDSRSSAPLADHVAEMTGFVRSQMDAFTDAARDFAAELYCSFASENGQSGFAILPADMATLARAGITLQVAVYSPVDADNTDTPEQTHDRFLTDTEHKTQEAWREALCQEFDLVDFVSRIADDVTPYRFGIKCQCPLHHDADHSLTVDTRRNRWHCFGECGEGGDAVTLMASLYEIPETEALARLAQMVSEKQN